MSNVIARLDQVSTLVRGGARWSAYGAAIIMGGCVVMTMVDILLRNLLNSGIPGIVDLTQLTVIWAAFLAIPVGFVLDNHIAVELIFDRLGSVGKAVIRAIGGLAGCVLLLLCLGWGWEQTRLQLEAGDRSMTIGIPMIWYWLPLLYGCALAALCALLAALRSLAGITRREVAS